MKDVVTIMRSLKLLVCIGILSTLCGYLFLHFFTYGNDMSISGSQPPTSNKPNLTELNISNCQINAEITTMDGFFSALPEIENLDLGDNRFYGPLPNPNP